MAIAELPDDGLAGLAEVLHQGGDQQLVGAAVEVGGVAGIVLADVGELQPELGRIGRRREGKGPRRDFGHQQSLEEELDPTLALFVVALDFLGGGGGDAGDFFDQAAVD